MSAARLLGTCRLLKAVLHDLGEIPPADLTVAETAFLQVLGPHAGELPRLAEIAHDEMAAAATRLLQAGDGANPLDPVSGTDAPAPRAKVTRIAE